jgi:glycosyltransferase involved in cell wall biosynthesis
VDNSVKPAPSDAIEISVVVPVRDEEDSIRSLIEGLLAQTLLPREIVITDGGSVDATREIIEGFINRGAPVRMFREHDSLPGRARNVGVEHAQSDWIAFTDAGTRPEPQWLAALASRVNQTGDVDVVYGSFAPITDSFFRECAAMAYLPPPLEIDGVLTSCKSIASAMMRRQVWAAVGGFPEHLRSAEDLLFMQKIEAQGFRELRAPEAMVHWNIQANLWRTFKRFVTYARNNLRAGLWRQWQAAIFLRYALLALIALPVFVFGERWLIVPLVCWLGLLVARAVKTLSRNRRAYPAGIGRNLMRLLMLLPIIASLDLAAFVGSLNWLLLDRRHPTGMRSNHGPQ